MPNVIGRRTRDDREIRNVPGLPKVITDNYRGDTHLGTVLEDYGVTSLYYLQQKLKNTKK